MLPDADMQPSPDDRSCPEDYSNPRHPATPSLREKIRAGILANGGLPFPDYLNLVLYDPRDGYYARTDTQVGRAGDFYTSVSVGPLFGQLLARRFLKWWLDSDKPENWRILEIGAHDGKLAADILSTLREIHPEAWASLEYAIAEPLPRLRIAQQKRLNPLSSHLRIAGSLEELSQNTLPGIAFGNEILDALPFHLVRQIGGEWMELYVGELADKNLVLVPQPIAGESPLSEKIGGLGMDFPEHYQTEIRTNFYDFLKNVSACVADGILIFIDYGFAAPEYYDTHRSTGTLRTFSKHKAAEDPLDRPGEIDITAHLDFTDLARAAINLGYHPSEFHNQGSYLTHLAKDLILTGSFNDPKSISQFQSLTHPAHLGGKFHVIEFQKNHEVTDSIRHRLAF